MHRTQVILSLLLLLAAAASAQSFSGKQALDDTRMATDLGPRVAGSPANKKLQGILAAHLKANGWTVIEDAFTAKTPYGAVAMKNVIGVKKGTSGRALVLTGHFDTKKFNFKFVGANDAGSSTGVLMEMARAMKDVKLKHDLYLVFFDGEEAFKDWTATDSLYGSRHLADKWNADGTLSRIDALINVDMIGDRDLSIVREAYSSDIVMRTIWQTASDLSYGKHFSNLQGAIEDDHVPFLKKGVRAVDLIDFSYGPDHSWWHTEQDTMDKLSANSLEVVGRVVAESLKRLDVQ